MQWLSEWLKQLIVIVLLAAFVDLILPNSSMQRYVKMVVSLFLILVLLSPIIQLFNSPREVEQRIATAQEQYRSAGGGSSIPALAEIYEQGEKLAAANESQTKQLVETQLAEQLTRDIRTQTGEAVQEIQVRTAQDKEGNPYIEQINVTLALIPGEETADDSASQDSKPIAHIEPVKPFEPIRIGSRAEQETAQGQANEPKTPADGSSAVLESRREIVSDYLLNRWEIESGQVVITFDHSG